MYKKEIVSAVLGAVFGGLVSLAAGLYAGLYSVTKTFQFQIKKDTITTLKWDLVKLKTVSRDINENIAIVGNPSTTIQPSLEFKPKVFPSIMQALEHKEKEFTNKETKEVFRMMKAFAELQDEQIVKEDWFEITDATIPTKELIIGAWSPGYWLTTEIDFDLTTKLDTLYRRLQSINDSIREIRAIVRGRFLPQTDKTRVEQLIKACNTDATELSRDLVTIKDAVSDEIRRLEKLREQLAA